MRPYVAKFLGESIASKLFGEKATALELPEIPTVEHSSTSTKSLPQESGKKEFSKKENNEYNRMYIEELYKVTRQTKPNLSDISKWMNVMSQGGTREGVYRALVLDGSYAGLEGIASPLNKRAAKFASAYMKRFLGKEISETAISKVNMYTVKRIMTEDSLEVIDQFLYEGKIEELYTWYSIMSSEFASEFPTAFKIKTRASQDVEAHLRWSHLVSWQVLKGEVIYKLHYLMNMLSKP